jgi:hypothetical protein
VPATSICQSVHLIVLRVISYLCISPLCHYKIIEGNLVVLCWLLGQVSNINDTSSTYNIEEGSTNLFSYGRVKHKWFTGSLMLLGTWNKEQATHVIKEIKLSRIIPIRHAKTQENSGYIFYFFKLAKLICLKVNFGSLRVFTYLPALIRDFHD